jgi:hypothetical protein
VVDVEYVPVTAGEFAKAIAALVPPLEAVVFVTTMFVPAVTAETFGRLLMPAVVKRAFVDKEFPRLPAAKPSMTKENVVELETVAPT